MCPDKVFFLLLFHKQYLKAVFFSPVSYQIVPPFQSEVLLLRFWLWLMNYVVGNNNCVADSHSKWNCILKRNLVSAAIFNFTLSSVSYRFAQPCVVMAWVPGDHKIVLRAVPHPIPGVLLFCRQKSRNSHLQYISFGKFWMISVLSYLVIVVSR